MGRNWTQYSDEEKAGALAELQAAGWPKRAGSMLQVARRLKVPESTLRSWARGEHGAPPANVRERKKGELAETLAGVAFALTERLMEIAKTGDVRETATALGIVIDKLQLLNGEPTQSVTHLILDR